LTSRDQVDIIAIGKLGLFEALAEMYATREAAIDLLRRAQVQLGRMPAFGEPTLGLYWQAVFWASCGRRWRTIPSTKSCRRRWSVASPVRGGSCA
jgi:hypothetical protein